ncbi:sensor histidine kinase [Frigoribacterium faeni]|uniref:sensor histidine kinase n=1 Tax=Frigoribacterium faeni TaxID=145483 RepID=UPI00141BE7E9|nr:ATP-binding protein [Frigoribacterium faeni]NIJ04260.1 signal transduction histidine kinase [Frigoribacterium faeni]
MLLGLPAHLVPQTVGRALSRACHVIASVVLASAGLLLIVNQVVEPTYLLWPALAALLPMLGMLFVVERSRSTTAVVAYLAIGSACLYWYAVTLFAQIPSVQASDAFSLSLPKIALVMVGGSGLRSRGSLLWATAGFALGEVVTQLATWQTGASPRVDVAVAFAWLLVSGTVAASLLARGRVRRAQPSLHRAAFDQQKQAIRHDVEQQAAALLHDTVLNHLSSIAAGGPGRLSPAAAASMAADLEVLVGQEWLSDEAVAAGAGPDDGGDWSGTELGLAVERARQGGLEVGVTGDVRALVGLSPAVCRALGLAVGQCLTNVAVHSGVDRAEVVVYGDGTDLTVMVIDDGVGFDVGATGPDRLGLKNSVEARTARVGGSAQVWSSPGSGTSVMIRVPVGGAEAVQVADGTPLTGPSAGAPVVLDLPDAAEGPERTQAGGATS